MVVCSVTWGNPRRRAMSRAVWPSPLASFVLMPFTSNSHRTASTLFNDAAQCSGV